MKAMDTTHNLKASSLARYEGEPSEHGSRTAWVLFAVLAFLLVKQLAWLAVIPIWQTPDEPAHFQYVQYLAETGRVPVFNPERPPNVSSAEVNHTEVNGSLNHLAFHPENRPLFTTSTLGPAEEALAKMTRADRLSDGNSSAAPYPPGYYYPAAFAYRLFGGDTVLARVFAVRALSILYVLVTAWAAFRVAGMLWSSLLVRASFALLVGLQPMLSMSGVSVNNDAMLVACGSLVALGLAIVWKHGASWRMGMALGIVAGVGMLTKPQMLPLVVIVPVAALAGTVARREGIGRLMGFLAGYAALLTGAYLPWILFCKAVYGAWMPSLLGLTTAPGLSLWEYAWQWLLQPGLSRTHVLWVVQFWGSFGWLDTVVEDPAYRLVTLFMVVGAIGAWRWIKSSQTEGRALLLGAGTVSLAFLAFLYLAEYQVVNRTGIPMLQGRYWLPVLVPTMLTVFAGCLYLAPTGKDRWTAAAIALGALCLNLACWLRLIERYYV